MVVLEWERLVQIGTAPNIPSALIMILHSIRLPNPRFTGCVYVMPPEVLDLSLCPVMWMMWRTFSFLEKGERTFMKEGIRWDIFQGALQALNQNSWVSKILFSMDL